MVRFTCWEPISRRPFYGLTGSLIVALVLMIPVMLLVGIVIELVVLRTLYDRDHMDQVLATFGLILFSTSLSGLSGALKHSR